MTGTPQARDGSRRAADPAGPVALRPDRLELGEGIRWTDRGIVLVDILAGTLFGAAGDPSEPLRRLARLPVPLGAVAPVADAPGSWIAAAGTGSCSSPPTGRRADWPSPRPAPCGPCA